MNDLKISFNHGMVCNYPPRGETSSVRYRTNCNVTRTNCNVTEVTVGASLVQEIQAKQAEREELKKRMAAHAAKITLGK